MSVIFGFWLCAVFAQGSEPVSIAINGNAYLTAGVSGAKIGKTGVTEWTNPEAVVSVFFSLQQPRKNVKLSLKARGNADYEVSCGQVKFPVSVSSEKDFAVVPVGTLNFDAPGYRRIDIRPVSKNGENFGEISELVLDGADIREMNFVHDFDPYWGMRGPSVHLRYHTPKNIDAEYFYSEMYVPEGMDPIGTFIMVCGFGEGYFGAQVNSEKERRILFSVWSPAKTDDPGNVPEEDKVILKSVGEAVKVGNFGNEGTGGQSYLVYPWKTGTTYRFLLRAHPCDDGTSEYSAFFFPPEEKKWRLVATFRRPKIQTWIKGVGAFLENFNPKTGWLTRSVGYSNQWLRDKDGRWFDLNKANFTCDSTGRAGVRLDYTGGLSSGKNFFYLANCGFFDDTTPDGSVFERTASNNPPEIDFEALKALSDSCAVES